MTTYLVGKAVEKKLFSQKILPVGTHSDVTFRRRLGLPLTKLHMPWPVDLALLFLCIYPEVHLRQCKVYPQGYSLKHYLLLKNVGSMCLGWICCNSFGFRTQDFSHTQYRLRKISKLSVSYNTKALWKYLDRGHQVRKHNGCWLLVACYAVGKLV